ncbi:type 4a pilus biogenesis protein PilO [Candidatus Peribacteria bacterium]|nr:type 4a pilus biogenesis protein PilO [Candidatus Peribacteria bacterium]
MSRLIPLILLVLLGVIAFRYTLPYQRDIARLTSEATRHEALQTQAFEQFHATEQKIADIKASKENILTQVPRTREQEQVMRDLQRISTATGYAFTQLSFSDTYDTELKAHSLIVSFAVKGPRNNILPFLRSIESNERFLSMDGLNVSLRREDDGREFALLEISLRAYYQ